MFACEHDYYPLCLRRWALSLFNYFAQHKYQHVPALCHRLLLLSPLSFVVITARRLQLRPLFRKWNMNNQFANLKARHWLLLRFFRRSRRHHPKLLLNWIATVCKCRLFRQIKKEKLVFLSLTKLRVDSWCKESTIVGWKFFCDVSSKSCLHSLCQQLENCPFALFFLNMLDFRTLG